jgi:LCP family protein required for cell wall assembly
MSLMVLIVTVFSLGGLALVFKKSNENLLRRDMQINLLMAEVGDMKDQNNQLSQTLSKNNEDLKDIYGRLITINKTINLELKEKERATILAQTKASSEVATVSAKLTEMEQQLQQKIAEKELTIGELTQKNLKMKQELQTPKIAEDVNSFLIMGQNGNLTDTIIVASINSQKNTVSLLNIPRDLFYKGRKINEIYAAYGIEKINQAVYEITGIYPQKFASFDFNSFIKVVDGLGGLDINVEKDIVDNQYPGANNSYTLVTFSKGLQHMDGNTALKFARSRKSTSDFDRSYRQQQIIAAVMAKVNSLNPMSAVPAYMSLYEEIKSKIKTNLDVFDALSYYDKCKDYKIKTGNILNSGNYLYGTKTKAGQYILLPAGGNYSKIKQYAYDLVSG